MRQILGACQIKGNVARTPDHEATRQDKALPKFSALARKVLVPGQAGFASPVTLRRIEAGDQAVRRWHHRNCWHGCKLGYFGLIDVEQGQHGTDDLGQLKRLTHRDAVQCRNKIAARQSTIRSTVSPENAPYRRGVASKAAAEPRRDCPDVGNGCRS